MFCFEYERGLGRWFEFKVTYRFGLLIEKPPLTDEARESPFPVLSDSTFRLTFRGINLINILNLRLSYVGEVYLPVGVFGWPILWHMEVEL